MTGASCSKESVSLKAMLERIPADADVACVINVKEWVESAGGSCDGNRIELPAYLAEDFGEAAEQLQRSFGIFDDSGLNLDLAGVSIDHQNGESTFIFKISDEDKFDSFVTRNGCEEMVLIKDGYAYIRASEKSSKDGNYRERAGELVEKAKKNPASKTDAGKYAVDGDGAFCTIINIPGGIGVSSFSSLPSLPSLPFMPRLFDGCIAVKGTLGKEKVELRSAWFDKDGKRLDADEVTPWSDASATLSSESLSYLSADEALVFAMELKNVDWNAVTKVFEKALSLAPMQRIVLNMVKTYLEKIDGTVAIGIGFDGNVADFESLLQGDYRLEWFPVTLVVQTAPGKAKGFVGDIAALIAAAGFSTDAIKDSFTVSLPEGMGWLYGSAEDNNVVFSTRPIKRHGDNPAVKAADMSSRAGAVAFALYGHSPISEFFGVKENLLVSAASDAKNAEGVIEIEVTGDGARGAAVERIIRVAAQFARGFEKVKQSAAADSNFTPMEQDEDFDYYDGFEPTYF